MSGCHSEAGRLFQILGPATEILLSPSRVSVFGTVRKRSEAWASGVCDQLAVGPKGGSKSELFIFWNKSQLQLNEVCDKVSVTENFQRQSCSTLISHHHHHHLILSKMAQYKIKQRMKAT